MDLEFYVRVRTCEKRVTGKQPSSIENNNSTHSKQIHFKIDGKQPSSMVFPKYIWQFFFEFLQKR